ncbi:flagellar hook-length control protein FliK [Bradyrhizobium sp. AUGA SZCCT0177]|uniref:flagellar hook-length control protein FliK n=1 Tax=Bradyrhizobium sp. AUGA SZCCT0177 TaxID=2807665 RepID=UPI001BACADE4|nr:flagellar hook-length control protein FliK [Bradyrhizobium sp. AUGA SZCCT0177]MBR1286483.1 flagellar hook-length control protein FliK [Bradyrhizobium sp. AUGA SZCCT0177]
MAISINKSVLPVLAAQEVGGVAPELVLAQGSVVNAQVLKILDANLVRIAISALSIDVATEIPLQAGQSLQLAVSQTKDGIRLALVGQGGAAGDAVTLSPQAMVDAAANRPTIVAPSKNVLTPLERAAVSVAAQSAATEQDSLAPLFANLGAAVSSANLPPKLQAAIAQVLAQQTSLDQNLDGGDIKTAFQKSGIFLEASLASGAVPSSGAPDLKAALIVLRQTLQSALGADAAVATKAAPAQAGLSNAAPGLVPSATPDLDVHEILLPQARLPVAQDQVQTRGGLQGALAQALNSGPSAGATMNLLQEALQQLGTPARPATPSKAAPGDDVTVHTNTPPPPFRGASPTAQPVALPSLAPDAPLATTAHHLLDDTDAAIARQTLLQVASLPDRIDVTGPKVDATTPRWNFEIPFVTPQGTAMAQFEIARDGSASEAEAAKRVWRARFSLDVEPTGPIHAQVSLSGEKTSVRMWAERSATAAQLRAGAAELSQALTRAELQPGEIVIRDGAPPQAAPAKAGHFLDRAL